MSACIHAEMSVFIKSDVTFAASLTHAAQPLIHSEWLDLSRKWDGDANEGGRTESERDGEQEAGERELSYSCSVGSALRNKKKHGGVSPLCQPPGSGERWKSWRNGALQRKN